MKYNYVPDTYDRDLIKEKFKDDDEFLKCQLEYKKAFEIILNKVYDFSGIDEKVNSDGVVPKAITDSKFFYHQTSSLQNNYVFLRNNFHVEKLDKEDIDNLKNGVITQDLFNRTLPDVIFEEGDEIFLGKPTDENLVKSKSLYFEFGYNTYDIDDFDLIEQIESKKDQIFGEIEEAFKGKIGIPISFITNDSIATIINEEEELTTAQDFTRPIMKN
ncbi:MAG: hypothetical protein IIZ67_01865 [Bacilli bacterium]|nr:hypothetical protein [Bacilli bacterium]